MNVFEETDTKTFPVSVNELGTRGLDDQVLSAPGLGAGEHEQTIPAIPSPPPRGHLQEEGDWSRVHKPHSNLDLQKAMSSSEDYFPICFFPTTFCKCKR